MLYSIFIYEPILIKIAINAHIMNMEMNMTSRGHSRSHKVTFLFAMKRLLFVLFILLFCDNFCLYCLLHLGIYKNDYLGIAKPTTPATTCPVWIPIRSWSVSFGRWWILKFFTAAKSSTARVAMLPACSWVFSGRPLTTM